MTQDLCELSAVQAVEQIRNGRITSEALVSACLARIADTDDVIKAWTWIDPDHALVQAKEADRIVRTGQATGALHGVCLLYTSPSPRDQRGSRMPSSA